MATDIYQKVESAFGSDAAKVHAIRNELDALTKGLISDRLLRAMIYLADGELARFETLVEEARNNSDEILR